MAKLFDVVQWQGDGYYGNADLWRHTSSFLKLGWWMPCKMGIIKT
jgi:hypothetical protein